ncbi:MULTISPECIES: glycolate oxidase subunit GlcF [unclassified Sphingopyxis]|uniref:glycolate oxidase subunit GlcF n=1 Tax=unclassified Sphingopyxis TaxID=2614943 RepID=UPI0007369079|nr:MULTISPECIES: glycolate oxidase subunit GlcF [unclassified Sphingopyxis]KTE43617.1 2-hydroxy-acid oxidase [Sphingopyxis sp. HIX]KTE85276.1 2-hydroxy-acid oxidase [Sphingopyxis sp. HXXIV]
MQTHFSPEQLADPAMASSEGVIRKCVHCGFCTATCPTYALLGDELDSPRGRIYLIKDMLENERAPSAEVVKHVDRCLSCLSCMTTCPSGVNYMHLVDHARAYIEERYARPWYERVVRRVLAAVLPYPGRFRLALDAAALAKPLAPLFAKLPGLKPLGAMLALAPRRVPGERPARSSCISHSKGRVALLRGCAEPVLRPEFQDAAIRLLNRIGYDTIFAPGEGCCGALVHHMGREGDSLDAARRNVDAWMREIEAGGLEAILVTASGCGTMIKDYGFMLRGDAAYAAKAARVSALAKDVSEFLAEVDLPAGDGRGLVVAYHAACSLQHGQKVVDAPKRLLAAAGYTVRTPAEAHLCCGSAGTYNILQPEIAGQLGDRKAAHLDRLDADVIATGNIGCATQIGLRTGTPVVHMVELLDWATGGPMPAALAGQNIGNGA